MSLLTRLGRPDEELEEEKPIFTAKQPVHRSVAEDSYQAVKLTVHQRLVNEMTPEQQDLLVAAGHDHEMVGDVDAMIASFCQVIFDEGSYNLSRAQKEALIVDIRNEMLGLGPLEPLLKDSSISEIMVNGAKKIFVERHGKIETTDVVFHDEAHLMNTIERILTPIGRRIDESSPMVDARLADGSRVNIIIPPLSLIGPCLTIRKFSQRPFTVDDLIGFGTLDEKIANFLKACVKARINILVSGGTGSGKTTMLNLLSSFIPSDERIVTIEDAAELRLQQDHVVTLEARPANIEGAGAITIRDLVKNALRMRPDRIIVGEVRAGEALDMLQAMNTGHDGSLTTAHANTPRDALSRLETMVLMSGIELPVRAIRDQISAGIDLVVHQSRIKDGSRKITQISEVQGLEENTIVMQDIFRYVQTDIDANGKSIGHFEATGMRPRFMEKFQINGVSLPDSIFFDTQKEG